MIGRPPEPNKDHHPYNTTQPFSSVGIYCSPVFGDKSLKFQAFCPKFGTACPDSPTKLDAHKPSSPRLTPPSKTHPHTHILEQPCPSPSSHFPRAHLIGQPPKQNRHDNRAPQLRSSVKDGVRPVPEDGDQGGEGHGEVREQVVCCGVGVEGVSGGVDEGRKGRKEGEEGRDAGVEDARRGHDVVHLRIQHREGDGRGKVHVRLEEGDDLRARSRRSHHQHVLLRWLVDAMVGLLVGVMVGWCGVTMVEAEDGNVSCVQLPSSSLRFSVLSVQFRDHVAFFDANFTVNSTFIFSSTFKVTSRVKFQNQTQKRIYSKSFQGRNINRKQQAKPFGTFTEKQAWAGG